MSDIEITVYSKPNCMQCEQTKNYLSKKGLEYTVVDVSENADAFEKIMNLGYRQVPVVMLGESHWSGFQPVKINQIASSF